MPVLTEYFLCLDTHASTFGNNKEIAETYDLVWTVWLLKQSTGRMKHSLQSRLWHSGYLVRKMGSTYSLTFSEILILGGVYFWWSSTAVRAMQCGTPWVWGRSWSEEVTVYLCEEGWLGHRLVTYVQKVGRTSQGEVRAQRQNERCSFLLTNTHLLRVKLQQVCEIIHSHL